MGERAQDEAIAAIIDGTGEPETVAAEITTIPINEAEIRSLIYTVRGRQVMLDSDLAMLYQVETRALNQAVSRNPKRFPERFCFRLTAEEAEILRSQIVTLHPEQGKQESWWRYMPRVFTEQGVSMLSAVLRSDTAIAVSVRIMDAFVEMRVRRDAGARYLQALVDSHARQVDSRLDGIERAMHGLANGLEALGGDD